MLLLDSQAALWVLTRRRVTGARLRTADRVLPALGRDFVIDTTH